MYDISKLVPFISQKEYEACFRMKGCAGIDQAVKDGVISRRKAR